MAVSADAVEKRIDDILEELGDSRGRVMPEILFAALIRRVAFLEVQHEDLKEKLSHIGVYL